VTLSPYPPGLPGPTAIGVLESFPILGEAKISGTEEITKLAVSLADGIRATDGDAKMCFNPRHAIRYGVHVLPRLCRHQLGFICANCAGELVQRPSRPAAKLVKNPASKVRVLRSKPCVPANKFGSTNVVMRWMSLNIWRRR